MPDVLIDEICVEKDPEPVPLVLLDEGGTFASAFFLRFANTG